MKEIKISKKVYEKDFKVKALGYCCEEVDKFFDEINMEIVKLERTNKELEERNEHLNSLLSVSEKKNASLSMDLANMKAQNAITSTSNANFSNIDLLNRIANLEKMVKELLDKHS